VCHNRLRMGHRLPHELLQELRTYLQHFDQTGHLGESSTVAEIKQRLNHRIAEVEAEVARGARPPSSPEGAARHERP
jgi:hypothetical protein